MLGGRVRAARGGAAEETGQWQVELVEQCVNGGLAGMVSICAGANVSYQWGAACTGAVAGVVFYLTAKLVARLHVDDPVDTVGVHFSAGVWGAIAQPIFKRGGILTTWTRIAFKVSLVVHLKLV